MKAIFILIISLTLYAETIKEVYDFRDNKYKLAQFTDRDKVLIYTTAENVTDLYMAELVNGKVIHYLKGKK